MTTSPQSPPTPDRLAQRRARVQAIRDGKRHYGDGLYEKAAGILGLEESSLRQYKWLAGLFELSTRVDKLSFKHHEQVASVKKLAKDAAGKLALSDETDHEKIAELLAQAEKEKLSVRELREAVRRHKEWQQEAGRIATKKSGRPKKAGHRDPLPLQRVLGTNEYAAAIRATTADRNAITYGVLLLAAKVGELCPATPRGETGRGKKNSHPAGESLPFHANTLTDYRKLTKYEAEGKIDAYYEAVEADIAEEELEP